MLTRPARDGLITALVALAAWGAAGGVWLLSGQVSLVLLATPFAWALVEAAARARKLRLAARVERAFRSLEAEDASGFAGVSAAILGRQARLLGMFPPRLIELRLTRMPTGEYFAVRAEVRNDAAPIQWRVSRLSPAQAQQWRQELA